MAKTLFISEEYLKTNSSIPLNLDNQYLRSFIIKAQEINIQKVLGSDLYNDIVSGVNNSDLTAAETTLLQDYIQSCLVEWATYTAFPHIHIRVMNIGIVKKDSDISDPIDLDELKFMRKQILEMAEFYSERMKDYLRENKNSFPNYLNPSDNLDTIKPDKSSQYTTGMYLPSLNTPDSDLDDDCCK